jgi:hypothetical protein
MYHCTYIYSFIVESIKFQFCTVRPVVVAYIALKTELRAAISHSKNLLISSMFLLHISAVLTIFRYLNM